MDRRVGRDRSALSMIRTRVATNPGGLLPLAFLTLFVAWPLLAVLIRSFTSASSGRAVEVLFRASTGRIILFTVGQAAANIVRISVSCIAWQIRKMAMAVIILQRY